MPDSQFSKAELPDFPPGLVAEASNGSLLPSGKVTPCNLDDADPFSLLTLTSPDL